MATAEHILFKKALCQASQDEKDIDQKSIIVKTPKIQIQLYQYKWMR
jgi:hypothetical protein